LQFSSCISPLGRKFLAPGRRTRAWEPASFVAEIMRLLVRYANHKLSISIIESLRWHSQSFAATFLRQAPFSSFFRPLDSSPSRCGEETDTRCTFAPSAVASY